MTLSVSSSWHKGKLKSLTHVLKETMVTSSDFQIILLSSDKVCIDTANTVEWMALLLPFVEFAVQINYHHQLWE